MPNTTQQVVVRYFRKRVCLWRNDLSPFFELGNKIAGRAQWITSGAALVGLAVRRSAANFAGRLTCSKAKAASVRRRLLVAT
jgi:hypothetical protein